MMKSDIISTFTSSRGRIVIWSAAVIVRVAFLIYGGFQDAYLEVPFTDVDYYVYTDAARHVLNNESPFLRHTFRYTPLLAFLLTPCHIIEFSFGKIMFTSMDLLLGYLIEQVCLIRRIPPHISVLCAASWLFNPMSFTVSTRGNADVIICLLVVLTIFLILKRQLILSSIVFGLAVHFKIYPIIYGPAVLVYLDHKYTDHDAPFRMGPTASRLLFFIVSASVFLGLLAYFYYIYGWTFVYETYLYHLIRRDNRHNFSPYFYSLYLSFMSPSSLWSGLLSFLPQIVSIAVVALKFGTDLPFAMFVQTVIFVSFNKVSTAQYFVWYWSLLPLILPYTRLSFLRGLMNVALWFAGQLLWLFFAYQLEMRSRPVFLLVWLAGLTFFWINCLVLVDIICHHRFRSCLTKQGDIDRWTSGNEIQSRSESSK